MRVLGKVAITTALLVPMVAASAEAQNYRWDLGVNGGYSWYRSMMNEEALGIEDASLGFKAGPLLGAQLGFWAAPNIGLRLNGTYADRPVELDGTGASTELLNNVNLWSGSLDLLWRFSRPNLDWQGTEILPYLALGLGAKWINPSGDYFDCVGGGGGDTSSCAPFAVGTTPTTTYALDEDRHIMGLVGLGTDVRLAPNFALRLEVNDRIYKPDLYAVTANTDGTFGYTAESVSRTVHEVSGQVGLHLLMGLARPQLVSVVPAPAPLPPPVQPAEPPPPTEETVTVCVVDPTVPNGIRTQTAYYRFAERDTVVMVNGARVPLNQAVGNVMVAREADWYVRGQPLTITVGNERIEYVSYMGARHIEADRLAYLGTVNGYPVYADRDEVADVMVTMNQLSDTERDRDLGVILAANRNLRTGLQGVQYLYVPVEPTGCVFQAVQRMEGVSKGK
jgi:opacity protein-like surface antigen